MTDYRFMGLAMVALGYGGPLYAQNTVPRAPSQREILSVPSIRGPAISPDGTEIAFSIRTPNWQTDRYENVLMLRTRAGIRPLSDKGDGSAYGPQWSPDGKSIAYYAAAGDIFLIDTASGRKTRLTAMEGAINNFKWSPTGKYLALLLAEPHARRLAAGTGSFHVEGVDHNYQHLWLLDVEAAKKQPVAANFEAVSGAAATLRRLTGGRAFTVHGAFDGDFNFTPDEREILFDHSINDAPESISTQDISAVNITNGAIRPVVKRPGIDQFPVPSPDGRKIAFHTAPGPHFHYGRQFGLATVDASGGTPTLISGKLADEGSLLAWRRSGIYFRQQMGVETQIMRMDPATMRAAQLTHAVNRVHVASVAANGDIAYVGESEKTARELYLVDKQGERRLTDVSAAMAHWPRYGVRLVRWKTVGGAEVEGVVYLPADFDTKPVARPTLVFLHGGPSGTYRPVRLFNDVYPFEYWLAKGAVIFAPNYRGSGGYGDAFRALNVRKLGVAYAEDVRTGIDHLVQQGITDPKLLGAMGWSAGGDAAAFLGLRSHRFKAVSVGAGISDPVLDYFSNDQPNKLEEYLLATPWSDPQIYRETSPMAGIATANTPTLIQHGRNDRRVSPVNAMALYRGLTAHKVDTALIFYERSGHYPSQPSDELAAAEHNRLWFDAYLWGDGARPDLTLEGKRPDF